jgi:hypothetical protein
MRAEEALSDFSVLHSCKRILRRIHLLPTSPQVARTVSLHVSESLRKHWCLPSLEDRYLPPPSVAAGPAGRLQSTQEAVGPCEGPSSSESSLAEEGAAAAGADAGEAEEDWVELEVESMVPFWMDRSSGARVVDNSLSLRGKQSLPVIEVSGKPQTLFSNINEVNSGSSSKTRTLNSRAVAPVSSFLAVIEAISWIIFFLFALFVPLRILEQKMRGIRKIRFSSYGDEIDPMISLFEFHFTEIDHVHLFSLSTK